jgi:hypothetical protein
LRDSERSIDSKENSVSVGWSLVLFVVVLIDFHFASFVGWFEGNRRFLIARVSHLLGHGDVQLLQFGSECQDVVDLGN